MASRTELVVCPGCSSHAKPTESACPFCGAALAVPRANELWALPAAVVALGLTAVTCSSTGSGGAGAGGNGGNTTSSQSTTSSPGSGGAGGH
jgi:hypothetical protein